MKIMRTIEIDLSKDTILDLSPSEIYRLKEIVQNSLPKKLDVNELDFEQLKNYYNAVFLKSMRVVCEKTKQQFNKRIKEGYTKADIRKWIDNASNDKFHEANDFKHVTLEFISRSDKFTKYVSELEHQEPRNVRLKRLKQGAVHTNH